MTTTLWDSSMYGYGTPVLPKDPKRGLKKATPKLRASAMTNTGMVGCFFSLACQWVFSSIDSFSLLIWLYDVVWLFVWIFYLFDFMCLFIWYVSIYLLIYFLAFGTFVISSPFPFSLFCSSSRTKEGNSSCSVESHGEESDLAVETTNKPRKNRGISTSFPKRQAASQTRQELSSRELAVEIDRLDGTEAASILENSLRIRIKQGVKRQKQHQLLQNAIDTLLHFFSSQMTVLPRFLMPFEVNQFTCSLSWSHHLYHHPKGTLRFLSR